MRRSSGGSRRSSVASLPRASRPGFGPGRRAGDAPRAAPHERADPRASTKPGRTTGDPEGRPHRALAIPPAPPRPRTWGPPARANRSGGPTSVGFRAESGTPAGAARRAERPRPKPSAPGAAGRRGSGLALGRHLDTVEGAGQLAGAHRVAKAGARAARLGPRRRPALGHRRGNWPVGGRAPGRESWCAGGAAQASPSVGTWTPSRELASWRGAHRVAKAGARAARLRPRRRSALGHRRGSWPVGGARTGSRKLVRGPARLGPRRRPALGHRRGNWPVGGRAPGRESWCAGRRGSGLAVVRHLDTVEETGQLAGAHRVAKAGARADAAQASPSSGTWTPSRKLASWRARTGWRNLRTALASIWRTRSRVTRKMRPTSSRV